MLEIHIPDSGFALVLPGGDDLEQNKATMWTAAGEALGVR
jgi:hypothetical protein